MCEGSGFHFVRTTTRIQSGPDAFEKSWLVVTFLTNLEVILYSFRLVLEGKASRFECLETFFGNSFALSEAEGNISTPLNREGTYVSFISVTHIIIIPSLKSKVYSKSGSHHPKKSVLCFIEIPLKIMKNAFYFISKAPFVLKIFKFLL